MRPGIARPQQNIQQINQPAAQAQQPPQGGSGSYQALVQALAAQQAGTQADRFRRSSQGAFKQPGLAGAVFGGLHGYLAGRKEKEQMEAQKESLRLQDDDARIEEMQESRQGMRNLRTSYRRHRHHMILFVSLLPLQPFMVLRTRRRRNWLQSTNRNWTARVEMRPNRSLRLVQSNASNWG
jgi:hypothetical protein